ncbi:hypothetical protein B4U80_06173, partial [Leptotrombidium deliense]
KDIKFANEWKEKILKYCNELLVSSLQKLDQNLISVALQVFHNFDLLSEKVDFIISEKNNILMNRIKEAFDAQHLSQSKQSGPGGVVISITVSQSNQFKTKLWLGIESLMEFLCVCFSQLNALFKVLKKKRDASNRFTFSTVACSENINLITLLEKTNQTLFEQMNKAVLECGTVKQALEMEFPKLLKLFAESWRRIEAVDKELKVEAMFRATLKPFESAYLSRSLMVLHDDVNAMFNDSNDNNSGVLSHSEPCVPSPQDIDSIVKSISKELSVAAIDEQLSKAVAKNISKAVHIFTTKCENIVCNDAESTQVISVPTSGQILNATIVERLESFRTQIEILLQSVNESISSTVYESLKGVDLLTKAIVEPLIFSVQDAIEAIILTIHQEDFSAETSSNNGQSQCSPYMKELQGFISRVNRDYFQLYSKSKTVQSCIMQIACRTTETFLKHVTLIRPLGNAGRARLGTDFRYLEEALLTIAPHVNEGSAKYYRSLRAFKPLIFQDAEQVSKSPIVGTLIPLSIILQYLISSFAPPELRSVHENKGWSISRYTKWLDEHNSEAERLPLIKDTLESYEKQVRQQHGKSFAAVYPIILRLLQQSLISK